MNAAAPSQPDLVGAARCRVVVAFTAVAAGIMLARAIPMVNATVWFAGAAGLCAAMIPARGWFCRVLLVITCAALSAGWYAGRIHEQPTDRLASRLAHSGAVEPCLITVEGVLLDSPHPRAAPGGELAAFLHAQPRTRFDLRLTGAITDGGLVPVSGRLWVAVGGAQQVTAHAGDTARMTGLFTGVDGPMNPGETDMRIAAAQGGFDGLLTLSGAGLIEKLPTAPSVAGQLESLFLRLRAWLQLRAQTVVERAGGDTGDATPAQSLLKGLILGDYDTSQPEVRDAFARQGLAHILSISGFHLAVMAMVALTLVRLTGDRGWVEPSIVALIVVAYVMVVPPSAPIMRSAAMVFVLLLAEASGRRYDRLTLLGWIAICLLIWRPADLWSLGYQLSIGLTGALFWLARPFKDRLFGPLLLGTLESRDRSLPRRAADFFKEAASAAILCWLISAPLIMLRIGLLSPFAIIATVLVTPIITVVLWIGYIALLIGSIIPPAADLAAGILSTLASWSIFVVHWIDGLPISSIRVPPVSIAWTCAATVVAIYWCRWGHSRDWRAWSGTAVVGAWMVWLCTLGQSLPVHTRLRIDIFAVGDGTCHLIRSGEEAMLWDCGSLNARGVQPVLVEAARAVGAWRTPIVVISHPDIDHFGALLDVAAPMGVETVIVGERFLAQAAEEPDGSAAALLNGLRDRNIEVRSVGVGDAWKFGHAQVQVLAPRAGTDWVNDNDHSLVVSMEVGTHAGPRSILLTGDIQDEAVAWLMDRHAHLRPSILELPHHGSAR